MTDSVDLPLIRRLSETSPRARKDYRCDICGQPIRKGVKHCRYSFIDEDSAPAARFGCLRYHILCPEV